MPALRIILESIEIKIINEPIHEPAGKKKEWFTKLIRKIKKMPKTNKNNYILFNKSKAKKFIISSLIAVFVFVQNPVTLSLAYDIPTAPSAPTPPPEPTAEPTPPPAPSSEAVAPTPPPAPTVEEYLNSSSTEEAEEEAAAETETAGSDTGSTTASTEQSALESSSQDEHSGEVADGQTGDTEIDTGDATNTASLVTTGNNNFSASASGGTGSGGATVANTGNGSESNNTGSVSVTNSNNTDQGNSANIGNNLNQSTVTGDNSTSENVGNSTINTGDANTSGTLITAVNTNVDGVMVSEFNIVDDHIGDIILDPLSGCITGCPGGDLNVINSGNGTDSTNTGTIDTVTNNNTFQENDASVENNMTLLSDSGNNDADNNTGGDSTINTGDANVSANALTFANNNLVGDVVYAVVNIYGNLVGDIILPDGTVLSCCITDATAANTGNGSDSQNTSTVNQSTDKDIAQFNNAEIDNNLWLDATTGDNNVNSNTGGDSSISTGDTDVLAQVVNIANTNIVGGYYWLVIVNEAGRWIGKILGSPDGTNVAGSSDFEITVDENGEILATNNGNGSGSTNTSTVNQETNNNISQTNDAKIVNNLDLTANTGDNSASRNTGGNSSITTGDANIVANIVNFVNNNIVGTGKLFVTVVNVFGSWLGDFVGPGYTQEENNYTADNHTGIGGSSDNGQNNESSAVQTASTEQTNDPAPLPQKSVASYITKTKAAMSTQGNSTVEGVSEEENQLAFATETAASPRSKKVIRINLAWLLVLLPLGTAYFIRRKRMNKLSA